MSGTNDADLLQNIIEEQQSLTTLHEQGVQSQISLWAALREADADALKTMIDWPADRMLVMDPLPSKISDAFADLLFGDDPQFIAAQTVEEQESRQQKSDLGSAQSALERQAVGMADESALVGPDREPPPDQAELVEEDATDQDRLDALVEANELPSELHHAEAVCSSEGEVWWRIYVDESQMDYPIIEWYSRSHVRPLFRGRKLIAAAFYSEIFREEVADQFQVYRWVGIYAQGVVRNLLYRGTPMQLGTSIGLNQRPETANLTSQWDHGYEMLCGRIPNKLGRDRRFGISDYLAVKNLIFALNEAVTIGHENARLAAKKRAVVPATALDETGRFDASEDVLTVEEELDTEMGKTASNKFAILEYSFDAEALIAWQEELASVILTRVGIAQQFVNASARSQGAEGMAASGTALRVRLIPTTLAANGKARFWDDELPKIIMLAQLVDKDQFAREWVYAGEPPAVERGQPLPEDEAEIITRHVMAVTGEIESRKTAIKDIHPDWTDDQVNQEMTQIANEMQLFGPPTKGAGEPPVGS